MSPQQYQELIVAVAAGAVGFMLLQPPSAVPKALRTFAERLGQARMPVALLALGAAIFLGYRAVAG